MKRLLLIAILAIGTFTTSNANDIIVSNAAETSIAQGKWYSTTGYHSDQTSISIQYYVASNSNKASAVKYYNGYGWCAGSIYYDMQHNGRRYTKNMNNKRYYF